MVLSIVLLSADKKALIKASLSVFAKLANEVRRRWRWRWWVPLTAIGYKDAPQLRAHGGRHVRGTADASAAAAVLDRAQSAARRGRRHRQQLVHHQARRCACMCVVRSRCGSVTASLICDLNKHYQQQFQPAIATVVRQMVEERVGQEMAARWAHRFVVQSAAVDQCRQCIKDFLGERPALCLVTHLTLLGGQSKTSCSKGPVSSRHGGGLCGPSRLARWGDGKGCAVTAATSSSP